MKIATEMPTERRSGTYSLSDLTSALREVGVKAGDTLVVHASLVHLGYIDDVEIAVYPRAVVDAVRDVLGPAGTLCVPTPFWDYGTKNAPFDTACSPVNKELGVVSAHVAQLPGRRRSLNPIFSMAALGPEAEFLCAGGTATAFGFDSAWDRLYRLDGRILLLGADTNSISLVRYIEHRFGVPYLYHKLFDAPILDEGEPSRLVGVTPVRYLKYGFDYDLSRFATRLGERGVINKTSLGSGTVKSLSCADCFEVGIECLKEDIYFFLDQKPAFVRGEIPFDVPPEPID